MPSQPDRSFTVLDSIGVRVAGVGVLHLAAGPFRSGGGAPTFRMAETDQ